MGVGRLHRHATPAEHLRRLGRPAAQSPFAQAPPAAPARADALRDLDVPLCMGSATLAASLTDTSALTPTEPVAVREGASVEYRYRFGRTSALRPSVCEPRVRARKTAELLAAAGWDLRAPEPGTQGPAPENAGPPYRRPRFRRTCDLLRGNALRAVAGADQPVVVLIERRRPGLDLILLRVGQG